MVGISRRVFLELDEELEQKSGAEEGLLEHPIAVTICYNPLLRGKDYPSRFVYNLNDCYPQEPLEGAP